MVLRLPSASRSLHGVAIVPGDKSLAHRVAVFAALAVGESTVDNYPDSGVTRAMREALSSLGIPSSLEHGTLRLVGHGFSPFRGEARISCVNSGTTFRLLAGAAAATRSAITLDGSEGLRHRPMERIAVPLRLMGVDVQTTDGHAPISLRPANLKGITYSLPVASAQVLSCLQLAALGAEGTSTFRTPGPVRDHTERILRAMGAHVESRGHESTVYPLAPAQGLDPIQGTLPGDVSSAAFLLAAAAIVPGSHITVVNVGLNPTRTGILDVLEAMGATVTISNRHESLGEPVGDITLEAAPLHGIDIGGELVVRCIDEFPAIAVVAAFADGLTVVRDAEELRYKESDRIAAIVSQLRALGADVSEAPDGFSVRGGTVRGGVAQANGDHRLAMSMALCGLCAPNPVTVVGAEILNESFPEFEPTLLALLSDRAAEINS